jgi:SAM-dependent methyltransferase
VCGSSALTGRFRSSRVTLVRCRSCGHHLVSHAVGGNAADYHDQYDEGRFLDSLRATRERQSSELAGMLSALGLGPELRVLDFGCGRGFLLGELHRRGIRAAGADYSTKSARLVRALGVEAHVVPSLETDALAELRASLSFAPTVLALLDVIEHFPPPELASDLRLLCGAFGESLAYLLVKVPVADGLLFRTAVLLAHVGLPAALEQMLQAGTSPAHQHYFSRRSLVRLLKEAAGADLISLHPDVEFEPAAFGSRVHALAGWPPAASSLLGASFAGAARVLHSEDSITVLARLRR